MRLNYYALLSVGILTALISVSIHHIIDDAPLFWVGVLMVASFSLGFVFGVFTED